MDEFDEYIRQGEPLRREKGYAWQTAIGLQAVDGLQPSDYLIKTARKDIEGEISIDEAEQLIKSYYQSKTARTPQDDETHEADTAALNIRRILAEKSFSFSLVGLTSIHKRIFNGIYKFAGKIRDYNITKKEWVLRSDTVLYVSAPDIKGAIEYDLKQEKEFSYSGLSMAEIVSHISTFVSGLWQIHPFGEGNTRTTAVFTILYLRSMGFDVENDLFAKNSWYFRNALVRANYQNVKKGIARNADYLEQFFRNLLMGENVELRNRRLLVDTPTSSPTSTPTSTPTSNVVNPTTNHNVNRLIKAVGDKQLSIKEIMEIIKLKDRENFMQYTLNPALKDGLIIQLYPNTPRHPRQKYLLTPKGMELYNNLS